MDIRRAELKQAGIQTGATWATVSASTWDGIGWTPRRWRLCKVKSLDRDEVRRRYDGKYERSEIAASTHFPAQFQFCLRLAGVQAARTVLDIGGGTGAHSLALQQMGMDVTLLDFSQVAIEKARASGVRRAIHGDFFGDTLGGEQFDVVLARSFSALNIDNLDEFADVVQRIKKCVANGGVVIYWAWTDLSRQWSSLGTFNHHPKFIVPLFDRVLLVPAFRALAHLPLAVAVVANNILCISPTPLPMRVAIIGVHRRT
jgi:SAM-dependent methyltransferase